jgi:hypothetical protein
MWKAVPVSVFKYQRARNGSTSSKVGGDGVTHHRMSIAQQNHSKMASAMLSYDKASGSSPLADTHNEFEKQEPPHTQHNLTSKDPKPPWTTPVMLSKPVFNVFAAIKASAKMCTKPPRRQQ